MCTLPSYDDGAAWNLPFISPSTTAWVAQAVAYGASDTEIHTVLHAANTSRLQQQSAALYNELLMLGEADVDMCQCEKKYDFRWELNHQNVHNDDEHFSRYIVHECTNSIQGFCIMLDLTCMSLAGLQEGQLSHGCLEDVMKVRNAATHELVQAVQSRFATPGDVVEKARQIEREYAPRCIAKHKAALREAYTGVRALSCIAAAAVEGRDMDEVLQLHYAPAREVCIHPPRQLTAQLQLSGIPMSVLRVCFVPPSVGASTLPPRWDKASHTVREFFTHDLVMPHFSNACVAALTIMRSELSESCNSPAWSGIDIVPASVAVGGDARGMAAAPTFDTVRALCPPSHRSGTADLAAIVVGQSQRGLRVVRFARALVKCAEAGLFAPRVVRASVLLACVARVRTERHFHLAELSDFVARTLEPRVGTACPAPGTHAGQAPAAPAAHTVPSQHTSAVLPTAPTVARTADVVQGQKGVVPLVLERDYHVISAVLRTVRPVGSTVALRDVSRILMASDGYCANYSSRSVEQTVAFVVKKCIEKMEHATPGAGTVEYIASVGGKHGGGSVRLDWVGANALLAFLKSTLECMESADSVWAKGWHASRSSRSKSHKAAVMRIVGPARLQPTSALSESR